MVMENLEQQICARVLSSCGETAAELFNFCQLQMIVVKDSSALLIECPNAWREQREKVGF